ncbi:MAG TPA: site-2 protease family protein [Longimicrobiaceae bacterium]|nr:site-2 protease family protein [Longimicrobiaceae bacterium]
MQELIIGLPVLIFSVVLHEVAHGWVARTQGDPTAYMLGRLTLNPIPHIDLFGSIIVPALMALLPGGLIFGWAKPVPVNPRNFRNYKRGDILVSLAGVAANFLLVIVFAVVMAAAQWGFALAPGLRPTWEIVAAMGQFGVIINIVLILFNLVPIPPLDGSHVFAYLLPARWAVRYRQIGFGGMVILLVLLWLPGFSTIIFAPVEWFYGMAMSLVHFLA